MNIHLVQSVPLPKNETSFIEEKFSAWMLAVMQRTELALRHALPSNTQIPQRLHQAMQYAVLGGGKRIRALLVHAAGELNRAPIDSLDIAASALEMIHAYSLIHDDLPCMDNDDMRRGKPTVHKVYDEALAILAGDALQTQAFIHLSTAALEHGQRIQLITELANAAGSLGMAGGQALDLENLGIKPDQTRLETMHRMKTGVLIRAAVRMGLICGEELSIDALDDYASAIGLAFQVVDDILDIKGQSNILGKTPGKDAANNKPTYVSILGLDAAYKLVQDLLEKALSSLEQFATTNNLFYLRKLAQLITLRTH